ncbi:hypothetical protein GGX14DRAFT_399489 [Mycena pura]|uniref:Uncharacterized protein n=1 Tax=Mycena pura TaxID=153505 RepID=A0AAD6V4M5_9AGAR|nr:hypothetical protein GGX14DRAFT_399489 [Mycena pura]
MDAVMGYARSSAGRRRAQRLYLPGVAQASLAARQVSWPYQALSRSATEFVQGPAVGRDATAVGPRSCYPRRHTYQIRAGWRNYTVKDTADGPPPGPRRRLQAVSQTLLSESVAALATAIVADSVGFSRGGLLLMGAPQETAAAPTFISG